MSTSMSLKTEEHKLGVVDPGLRLFGKSIVPAVAVAVAAGPMNKVDDAPVHLLQDEDSEVQTVFSSDEAVTTEIKSQVTQRALNPPRQGTPCPRCQSKETKFCYFNNYNVNQPRHFCKGCHRYWTAGGNLRNVPVGAGRRKSKSAHNKLLSSTPETSMVRIDSSDAAQAPLVCSGIAHPEPLHNLPPSSCKVHSQEVVPPSLTAHLVASHDVSDTPPSGITHQVSFHAGEDALPPGGITPVVPFHAKKEQPPPMGTTNPVQFHAKQEDAHPPAGKAIPMSFHARQDTCPPIGLTHGVPFHAGQDPPSSSGIDNTDTEGEGHNLATDMPSTNPLALLCQPDPKWGSANGNYFPLPVPYGGVPWAFMPTFGYPGASSVPPPHPFWNPYGWTVPWAMPWNLRSMSHEIPPHTVKRPRPNPSAPNELTDSLICVPKSLQISDEEVTSGSSILSTLGLSIKVEATSAGFFNGFQPKAEVFQPKPASKVPNPVAFSNSLAFQES